MTLPVVSIATISNSANVRLGAYAGTATISGTTKLNGTTSECRVYLLDQAGTVVDFTLSSSAGAYSFYNLAPGRYRIMILDNGTDSYRGQIEHVNVT